ncbi:hypothetical protein THAOC_19174 [Thalassiosira oceanica]|uniref:Uncharacterized protein n=1 Tax=Thalassiosira oceanica TaxID=159749 RepID=K0S2Y1_THAOC|nr:hypothetical protein THAOC_19174 [Thalassiosira oceanica]|eukprot:EJK60468.1 hypothetical protein THAOC_19174 [Thalassiosira oceanica]
MERKGFGEAKLRLLKQVSIRAGWELCSNNAQGPAESGSASIGWRHGGRYRAAPVEPLRARTSKSALGLSRRKVSAWRGPRPPHQFRTVDCRIRILRGRNELFLVEKPPSSQSRSERRPETAPSCSVLPCSLRTSPGHVYLRRVAIENLPGRPARARLHPPDEAAIASASIFVEGHRVEGATDISLGVLAGETPPHIRSSDGTAPTVLRTPFPPALWGDGAHRPVLVCSSSPGGKDAGPSPPSSAVPLR